MRLPWYLAALGAAMVWGLHYPLTGYALKKVSIFTTVVLTGLPILFVGVFAYPYLVQDWAIFRSLSWAERLPILAIPFTSIIATLLLYVAIGSKNATLASLIEISYPAFVVLFAYLLFRE